MDIKEGEIDKIHQNKNFGFKEKSIEVSKLFITFMYEATSYINILMIYLKVFKLFKSRRGEYNNWQQILIRALNDARRKDLVQLVEDIIMNEQ